MVQAVGFIVSEYGLGYIIIRSPYTPYSICLRGSIGYRVRFWVFKTSRLLAQVGTVKDLKLGLPEPESLRV